MKEPLAKEIYLTFKVFTHRRKKWWGFDYCFSIYQTRLAFCLDSLDKGKGKIGFTLFLNHLAEMVKQSNLEKIDIVRTVNSFSEQGIAISFGLNNLVPNNMLYNFLSMTSYGQQILMRLEGCLSRDSIGFTVF